MSPVENPKVTIACSVTNEAAIQNVRRSVEVEGGSIIRIQPSGIAASGGRGHDYAALIYDLSPWDDRAVVGLNRLRRTRPEMPILFYVPPVSQAVALIPRCGRLINVRLLMQERNGNGAPNLQRDIGWLIRSVPSREILARLNGVLPDMPPILRGLAQYVLGSRGTERRATVGGAARALGLSRRTLERRVRADHLPPAKELIDWIMLLHVSFIAQRGHTSISKVARFAGVNPNGLYRTKRRLADRAGREIVSRTEAWFSDAVAAFAVRCRTFANGAAPANPVEYTTAGYLTY